MIHTKNYKECTEKDGLILPVCISCGADATEGTVVLIERNPKMICFKTAITLCPECKKKLADEISEEETAELLPVDNRAYPYGLLFKCGKCGAELIVNDALEHNYCRECGRKFLK